MATYQWKTFIFVGATMAEATEGFDAWFQYVPLAGMGAPREIRASADHALYYHLTAVVPPSGGYELHVTALLPVAEKNE